MSQTAVVALSVLVADDEQGIRNLLRHWLESHGHSVMLVDCGHEAIRLLNAHPFDLIITDVVMPDGDGFELIAAFRKAQPQARIVAISGGGKYLQGPDCLKIARGLGAHAVVVKPFNWEQLHAGIDLALRAEDSESYG